MSQENVEILQRLYEAFNRQDVDDALQCLHGDIQLYLAITAPGRPSSFRGGEGAREFLEVTIEDSGEGDGCNKGDDRSSGQPSPRG